MEIDYFENLYNKYYKENSITKETYLSDLDKYDCYKAHFLKASYYFKKESNILKAKEEIDISVSQIENNLNTFFIERKFKIYFLAGEIYSNIKEFEKSKEYYNRFQYYAIQLKSDFENIDSGVVYSFRKVSNYSFSDLISNSITVCNPSKMNDPFDSLFLLWSSKENLDKICNNKSHIKSFSDSFQYFKIRSFVGNDFLTSDDSIISKKISMWSHYADEHRGFCIRYKLSSEFIKKSENTEYNHRFLKKIIIQLPNEEISVSNKQMNTSELLFYKSHEWANENEIRLLSYDPSCKESHQQILLDERSIIEAIYFGYRCTKSNIIDIMLILGETVEYYKMECDYDNVYKLKISAIKFDYIL